MAKTKTKMNKFFAAFRSRANAADDDDFEYVVDMGNGVFDGLNCMSSWSSC
jgi:hypothetical protein